MTHNLWCSSMFFVVLCSSIIHSSRWSEPSSVDSFASVASLACTAHDRRNAGGFAVVTPDEPLGGNVRHWKLLYKHKLSQAIKSLFNPIKAWLILVQYFCRSRDISHIQPHSAGSTCSCVCAMQGDWCLCHPPLRCSLTFTSVDCSNPRNTATCLRCQADFVVLCADAKERHDVTAAIQADKYNRRSVCVGPLLMMTRASSATLSLGRPTLVVPTIPKQHIMVW